jgi:hypothetical protein
MPVEVRPKPADGRIDKCFIVCLNLWCAIDELSEFRSVDYRFME